MNKLYRISGFLIAFSLFVPALALAQQATVSSSSTVDAQVQSLLSQITSLQQQLRSLLQAAASTTPPHGWGQGTSTPSTWNASSTPPIGQGSGDGHANCSVFSRNLSVGSHGDDVSELQQLLAGEGFLSASSTGFFGPLTAHALGEFQAHFGIASSSTGSFGPLTRIFVQNHCGHDGQGNQNGNGPLRPAGDDRWQNGSSTPSWGQGQPIFHGLNNASSSSSTIPQPPCEAISNGQPFNPCDHEGHGPNSGGQGQNH